MSEGHPTAPQLEALAILAENGPLSAAELAARMMRRRTTTPAATAATRHRPGVPRPIQRAGLMRGMAEQLLWRLAAQHLVTGHHDHRWAIADSGRAVLVSRAATVNARGT